MSSPKESGGPQRSLFEFKEPGRGFSRWFTVLEIDSPQGFFRFKDKNLPCRVTLRTEPEREGKNLWEILVPPGTQQSRLMPSEPPTEPKASMPDCAASSVVGFLFFGACAIFAHALYLAI